MAVNQRAEETVRLAMPENIRTGEARAALTPAALRRLGHGQQSGIEDAGAGRVARKAGAITPSTRKDAVAQAERRPSEGAHHEVAQALAEAALHDRAGHEEGDDDQEDRAVGEPRVGLGRGQRPGEHGRGEGEDGRSQDGKRADHDRDDGGDEEGEEVPGLGNEASGTGENQSPRARARTAARTASAFRPAGDRVTVSSLPAHAPPRGAPRGLDRAIVGGEDGTAR